MKEWPSKHGKIILYSLIFIAVWIFVNQYFDLYETQLKNIIYQSSGPFIDRRADAAEIGPWHFIDHLRVVWPTFMVVGFIGLSIFKFGCIAVARSCLTLLFALFLSVLLLTSFIDFVQFLIIVLPIGSSYFLASGFFKQNDIIDKINQSCLFLFCQILLITQVLSIFKLLTGMNFLIGVGIVFFLSLLFAKDLRRTVQADQDKIKIMFNKLYLYMDANRLLAVFVCAVVISILWRSILILYYPPNSGDSMHYHLSRVAYWMQHETIGYFYTYNWRQVCFPFNSEILLLWTMIASKLDYLCGYIQLACYVLSGTLLYKFMRVIMKLEGKTCLNIVLIWCSLPIVVVQSTAPKNDILVAYLSMATLLYFFRGIQGRLHFLVLSSMSLGLAIGTKVTALFFALPFCFLFLCGMIRKIIKISDAILWAGLSFVFTVTLGGYIYIQNYIHFRNIFGPEEFVAYHKISNLTPGGIGSVLFENIFTLITNQSGLHFYISILSHHYNDFAAKIGEIIFGVFHITPNIPGTFEHFPFAFNNWLAKFTIHETIASFGFVGAVIFFLSLGAIFFVFSTGRKKFLYFLLCSYLFWAYLILLSLSKMWDPWIGRFMITNILLGMPLLALICREPFNRKRIFINFLSVYSIFMLVPATFMNLKKPLTPYEKVSTEIWYDSSIWEGEEYRKKGLSPCVINRDRIGLRHLLRNFDEAAIRKINALVPQQATLCVAYNDYQWDYPLFAKGLKRELIPINEENIFRYKCEYVIVSERALRRKEKLRQILEEQYPPKKLVGRVYSGGIVYIYQK